MSSDGSRRSLVVQVVLFDDRLESIESLGRSIGAAVRHARRSGRIGQVVWRLGDCSRWPCLPPDAAEVLTAAVGDGLDNVTSRFFGANLGSAGGSNALAAAGGEDLIWVLNPDTYPAPDSLSWLIDAIAVDRRVALSESRQIPIEHQKCYNVVTGETSWASGFSLLARREAFDEVVGFDDHFFPLYCDDVDLSWRLRLAGWKVVHVPRSVVFHDKSIDTDGGVRWTPSSARSSTIAALWLYRRYGRPDLEAELVSELESSRDPLAISVLDEYRRHSDAGDVPNPLAHAERVATFVDGQLAPRRFSYVG